MHGEEAVEEAGSFMVKIIQPPKSQYMHDDKEIRGKTTNKQTKQKTSS